MSRPVFPQLGRLAYGADYNPEQWPRTVWPEDARLMREAKVNLVSLGIFAWAELQPAPDRWEFAWLDEVMDLLHAQGVRVNLATATASPPAWLVQAHPEMLPVLADGTVLGTGSRQHYAPWSQAYRAAAAQLVRALATRYGRHPALVSWHINNELGCHVKESFDDETIGLWRRWLRQRHRTIDALNHAWNTAFWSQRYADFEQIGAPRCTPTFINPGMNLDWRRFSAEAFTDLVRREAAILRELSPGIPLSTNFVGWHDAPWVDHRAVAAELDYVSWDSYPDPSGGLAWAQVNALCHDFMRSLKPGRAFVLMEQAIGGVNWRAVNQPRTSAQTRLFTQQAVAHGSDGAMFFQWRQAAAGSEQFHSAMIPVAGLEVAGREHRHWTLAKRLGAELAGHTGLAGSTCRAEVALLMDYESMWFCEQESKPTRLDVRQEYARYHRPLWRRNVAVDMRHPEDDLAGYRLVIAPALPLLTAAGAENLRRFVQRGGHLLFTPFCGLVDADGRFHPGGFPGRLTDIFGYAVEEWWPVPAGQGGAIAADGWGPMRWAQFADSGHVTDAEVLGTFADGPLAGQPALCRRRGAGGTAWYLAASLESESVDRLISAVLAEANIRGIETTVEGLEACLRTGDGRRWLLAANHAAQPGQIVLDGRTWDVEAGEVLTVELTDC